VNPFNYTVAPPVSHSGRDWFDSVTVEELLKLTARKFSPVVKNDSGWSGIATKPLAVE